MICQDCGVWLGLHAPDAPGMLCPECEGPTPLLTEAEIRAWAADKVARIMIRHQNDPEPSEAADQD